MPASCSLSVAGITGGLSGSSQHGGFARLRRPTALRPGKMSARTTPVRSLGWLELAFSQLFQALAYARTRTIRHVFHIAHDTLQPLSVLTPRAQLAYRTPYPPQALVLDQRRLGARQGRQRTTPNPQPTVGSETPRYFAASTTGTPRAALGAARLSCLPIAISCSASTIMLGSHTHTLSEGLRFFKPFPKAVAMRSPSQTDWVAWRIPCKGARSTVDRRRPLAARIARSSRCPNRSRAQAAAR